MIAAIIQARLNSSRFPRKILADVNGRPMIERVVHRALLIPGVERVVVAIPGVAGVDALMDCGYGPRTYQAQIGGDENDVLYRYHRTAQMVKADVIVRITADCPLLDPYLSCDVLGRFMATGADYADNVADNTDGWDTEVFTRELLETAHQRATDPLDREHVTRWMRNQPWVKRAWVRVPGEAPKMSVDTPDDLERVRQVYAAIGKDVFSRDDALDVLRWLGWTPLLTEAT